MKITVTKKVEIEVVQLKVSAKVRYWEDGTVDGVEDTDGKLIPCRKGDNWEPIIILSTGQISNWNVGTTASVHYKVCDAGIYKLADETGKVVSEKEGYVPDCLSPGGNGYGDYIIMDIDAEGFIKDWEPELGDFEQDED